MSNLDSSLVLAQNVLLSEHGLEIHDIQQTLDSLALKAIDQADLYFESSHSESWVLEDGNVKQGSYSIDQGVGIRAISGEKTGFAYSDEITLNAIGQAAQAARAIVNQGNNQSTAVCKEDTAVTLYQPIDPISSISTEEKIAILQKINTLAGQQDPRVSQVIASLSASHTIVLVANNEGLLTADIRPLIRLNVNVIVEQNGRRERGGTGGGGRFDYHYFLDNKKPEDYVNKAVSQALINLEARDAPAGNMQVVLGPGWPGILLHEAIGHGLEGDFNRKQTSAFCGKLGERVAAPGINVIDDGSLKQRRGSLNIDDEGTPTTTTVLIEDGILKNYMQDLLNARLMKMSPTGNGRRESYAHLPMPRMTNTFMTAGKYKPDEIIASVKRGIYATQFGGGQVDITSGKFVFNASQAWLIENGKLSHPLKGVCFIGNGPEVLKKVSMVGNDMELDPGIGVCGKEGQSVPVGVGQPTLRIDELTVGGTQT